LKSEFSKDVYPDVLELLYVIVKHLGFTESIGNQQEQEVSRFKRVLLFKNPKYSLKNYSNLLSIVENALYSGLENYGLTLLIEPFQNAVRLYREFSGVSVNLFKNQMQNFQIKLLTFILLPFIYFIRTSSSKWAEIILDQDYFLLPISKNKSATNRLIDFLVSIVESPEILDYDTQKTWRSRKHANPELSDALPLLDEASKKSQYNLTDLQSVLIVTKLISLLTNNWYGTDDYIPHIILKTKEIKQPLIPPLSFGKHLFEMEWEKELSNMPTIPEIEEMLNKLNDNNYQKWIPVISAKLSTKGISTWYQSRIHLELIAIQVESTKAKKIGDLPLSLSLIRELFSIHKTKDNLLFNPPMTEIFLYLGMIYIQIQKPLEGLKLLQKAIKAQCFYYPHIKDRIIMDGVSLSAFLNQKRLYLFFRNYGYKEGFYPNPVETLTNEEIDSAKKFMGNIYNPKNHFLKEDREFFLKTVRTDTLPDSI
jgi:hypothetical protein